MSRSAICNLKPAIERSQPIRPFLAMMLTALLWSTSGLLIKVIAIDAAPLAGWRSGIAAVTLWIIARAFGIRVGFPVGFYRGLLFSVLR